MESAKLYSHINVPTVILVQSIVYLIIYYLFICCSSMMSISNDIKYDFHGRVLKQYSNSIISYMSQQINNNIGNFYSAHIHPARCSKRSNITPALHMYPYFIDMILYTVSPNHHCKNLVYKYGKGDILFGGGGGGGGG